MTTTTVIARNGSSLSGDTQAAGWAAYINGGDYTDEQQASLVEALMAAQRAEFEARLPEGCHWYPTLSEVHGPVGTDIDDIDLDDLMGEAVEVVAGRYEQIEAETLGGEAVRHPEGTPEYEAYRAELTAELGKFAQREGEYR